VKSLFNFILNGSKDPMKQPKAHKMRLKQPQNGAKLNLKQPKEATRIEPTRTHERRTLAKIKQHG